MIVRSVATRRDVRGLSLTGGLSHRAGAQLGFQCVSKPSRIAPVRRRADGGDASRCSHTLHPRRSLAEGVGFEPTRHFCPPVFKTGSIGRSDSPPDDRSCRNDRVSSLSDAVPASLPARSGSTLEHPPIWGNLRGRPVPPPAPAPSSRSVPPFPVRRVVTPGGSGQRHALHMRPLEGSPLPGCHNLRVRTALHPPYAPTRGRRASSARAPDDARPSA